MQPNPRMPPRWALLAFTALMLAVGIIGGLWLHSALTGNDQVRSVVAVTPRAERPAQAPMQPLKHGASTQLPKYEAVPLPPVSAGSNRPHRSQSHRTRKQRASTNTPGLNGRKVLEGITVALDPGHNGGNASHPEEINRPVIAAADGATKACNTTGTETNDGLLTEAEFNFDIAKALRKKLTALGAKVAMTRSSNSGVGPCVNERAEIANRAGAAALISIHADGNESEGAHGFDVIHALPVQMVQPSLAGPSFSLAKSVRDALVHTGVPSANYVGEDGLDARSDLGGLNLARVPAVLVELGNMRSAEEAQLLETASYRSTLADALASGVRRYLGRAHF